jgi:hypothetical protein
VLPIWDDWLTRAGKPPPPPPEEPAVSSVPPPRNSRTPAVVARDRQVLDVLRAAEKPLMPAEVARRVRCSHGLARESLFHLRRAKLARYRGGGGYGGWTATT